MVFSSWEFVLGFLPLALAGFFLLGKLRHDLAIVWLVLASLAFYGWWSVPYLGLLAGSIFFNFFFAVAMFRAGSMTASRPILFAAVTLNLALLLYFKYANFIVANLALAVGAQVGPVVVAELPPGISFFTFTQIAFLVDIHRRTANPYSLRDYGLFVSYFPHLIAGPILHHREMTPQFQDRSISTINLAHIGIGLSIFAIGMFKKLVLADGLAPFVGPVFDSPARVLTFWSAWGAALAYTFQLYFDFSGYCDMAIGISILFNIRIPINFHSPYKATSIIEFWRCWHITLGRFLRDYVYVPLGGNRRGPLRKYLNLFATMLIGGAWHGANWTFIVWGAIHGAALLVNHAWRSLVATRSVTFPGSRGLATGAAWLVTFLVVVVAWVFFRAPSLAAALDILSAMATPAAPNARDLLAGSSLTNELWRFLQSIGIPLERLNARAGGVMIIGPALGQTLAILICFAIVLLMPNTQQIMSRTSSFLLPLGYTFDLSGWLHFRPNPAWAVALALLLTAALLHMTRLSPFLYFQF